MKPAGAWRDELREAPLPPDLVLEEGRGGKPTLRAGSIYLHSRYNPEQEAERLVDSAALDPQRPVLVIGLGLGYHVAALRARGLEVAVLEPSTAVARLALETGVLPEEVLLGVGDPAALAADEAFQAFARRTPQLLIHPPTAHLHPEYADAATAAIAHAALKGRHLNIAVVGPMFGGSLPMLDYLVRAFRKLGHRTIPIDNSEGWALYQAMSGSVKTEHAQGQLGSLLTQFLAEWTYARVAEFEPEICIVLAQAPVSTSFPARLRKQGILSAFWFVENWRHMPYWKDIAPYYDYFFHIQPGPFAQKLDEIGCRHHAPLPTACDPEAHAPVTLSAEEQHKFGCDIAFAGAGYPNRNELFKGLTDYDFKLWGVNWNARELQKNVCDNEERFSTEKYMKIVAGAKINVNLHSSTQSDGIDPECDAVNPRVFEIAAGGGFQVCDPCKGLDDLFDFEKELPVYRSLAELRRQIDHYLANPDEREAIATAARERVLRDHTYERRAQQMLDLLLEKHGHRLLKQGVRVQKGVSEMLDDAKDLPELQAFLKQLPQDALFTQENLAPLIRAMAPPRSYAANVFMYLNEVKEFAETLFKERR